ncbi:N-acetyltransferase-like protein [Thermochaetoides thermophila DSM 1495]|uniref:N-acetyltransferase-like protein n=1 Tax=Chaetomium thermophilum (strain DSM 1495 / CBS 144.50 / IMI 039719) TaxID=759272 RepID=G0S1V5_CHATD|nr:N-acetyltransferase-like protein [Thermochaetoides thermophila DSM 1495]EGS23015.1 N-acetyltransferase-like protein [Thermochaetoides thermophila DSM 1495]
MSASRQASIKSFFQPRGLPTHNTTFSSKTPPTDRATQTTTPPPVPPPAPAPPSHQPAAPEPITISVRLPPGGVPNLPSPPSLPSGASIVPLAQEHIPALRRINSLLLPVAYPDSFYHKALDPLASGLFSRAILWQDTNADPPKVVGGLICRLEPNPFLSVTGEPTPVQLPADQPQRAPQAPKDTPFHAIYIQSLALLSPYRSLGLAAAALDHIIATAAVLPAAGSNIDARTIYAHVWTENEEGLKWYESRGFVKEGGEPVKGYYFKLRPDTAWIVRRHIGESAKLNDVVSQPQPQPQQQLQQQPAVDIAPTATSVLAAAVNLPPITSTPPPPSTGSKLPTSNTSTLASRPPPPLRSTSSSTSSATSLSYQNTRPPTEWNDIPPDMVAGPPIAARGRRVTAAAASDPAANGCSGTGSGASSRSASAAAGTGKKRKGRDYPTAAFGN